MRTICLIPITLFLVVLTAHAQLIEDEFTFYDLGDLGIQNPMVWTTWSGIPNDGTNLLIVDDFIPPSGSVQQAYMGPNATQNCLLNLYNLASGDYILYLSLYIPSGGNASLNIQGETETNATTGFQGAGAGGAGVYNSGMMYFDGTSGVSQTGEFTDFTTGETGAFPLDEFFGFRIDFDLDNVKYHIKPVYQGMQINSNPVPFQSDAVLGGINFTSTDSNTRYWMDWVFFSEPAIADMNDFSQTKFKFSPNPVTDVLHIQSEAVISKIDVYNMLGKQVLTALPNVISPKVDMSNLPSGMYLMTVTIDEISRTFKVLK